ncbi:MAG: WD40 repeat domain-containing protein [Spirochaetaceae bacterium]|jgi:hypothetical protein|nr:WD40 repeat domain-containing protein [Spirochaetaceae bacterium]
MAQIKKKYVIPLAAVASLLYAFAVASPVTEETVLSLKWIKSIENGYDEQTGANEQIFPFELGDSFGYISQDGRFSVNRTKKAYISLSDYFWAEYGAQDDFISVKGPRNEDVFNIEDAYGYPFFLDSRSFIIHSDQNSVSQLEMVQSGSPGTVKTAWSYDFTSPISCVDAAAGLFLAGTLDGTIELVDGAGKRLYFSEPSGSRITAIFGCALSKDGKKIALVSGVDKQRFIFIEQFGVSWRITFHEFIGEGLRRNVYVMFVDNGDKVVFEREGGLGIYDVKTRSIYSVALDGEIAALDGGNNNGMLFLINSKNEYEKKLIGIKLPNTVAIEAPFNSADTFLSVQDDDLFVGGRTAIASFVIEKK